MAYSDLLNNVSPASQASVIYDLKETMKAAGYTVQGSGDGIAAHSAVGDVITSAGAGAGGMNNSTAWFTIRQASGGAAPYSGTREWTFQRGSSANLWQCLYSGPDTTFDQSTGTATTLPTGVVPADIKNFTNGSGFIAILPGSTAFTYQIRVGDSAEDFHWYAICYPNGGGNINGRVGNIPMTSDSIATGEGDPYIVGASANSLLQATITSITAAEFFGWQGKNGLIDDFRQINTLRLVNSAGQIIFPDGSGPNPENGQSDGVCTYWARQGGNVAQGLKGAAQKVKWTGTDRTTGSTYDTLNFIVFDDTVWEWDGSTVPSV